MKHQPKTSQGRKTKAAKRTPFPPPSLKEGSSSNKTPEQHPVNGRQLAEAPKKTRLWMLNPDDYPHDPIKQARIRKAKKGRGEREVQKMKLEEAEARIQTLVAVLIFLIESLLID